MYLAKSKKTSDLISTIYFLTITGSIISVFLFYLMLLGPLFVLIPWLFYFRFKVNSEYLNGWSWLRASSIFVFVYISAYLLSLLYFYIIFNGNSQITLLLCFVMVLTLFVHSSFRFVHAIRTVK